MGDEDKQRFWHTMNGTIGCTTCKYGIPKRSEDRSEDGYSTWWECGYVNPVGSCYELNKWPDWEYRGDNDE